MRRALLMMLVGVALAPALVYVALRVGAVNAPEPVPVDSLVDGLCSDDLAVVREAQRALVERGPSVLPDLHHALGRIVVRWDRTTYNEPYLCEMDGGSGGGRVVDRPLMKALRAQALQIVDTIGALRGSLEDAVDHALLRNPDPTMAHSRTSDLGELLSAGPRGLAGRLEPAVLAVLERARGSAKARRSRAGALGALADPSWGGRGEIHADAATRLQECLDDPNARVVIWAGESLVRLASAPRTLPKDQVLRLARGLRAGLVGKDDPFIRNAARRALGKAIKRMSDDEGLDAERLLWAVEHGSDDR